MSQDLEFLIAQYLDGSLPARERSDLERRLADDPAAARFLEEQRKLDRALNDVGPMPAINWDALALRISAAVAMAPAPVRRHKRPRAWVGAAVALAACVLVVAGIALLMARPAASPDLSGAMEAAAVVIGPQAEPAPGQPVIAQVTLSSPAGPAVDDLAAQDARPSHVFISSAISH
jgi:anti-sigma factor RsiW